MLCGAGLVVGLVFGGGLGFGQEKLGGKIYSEREIKKVVPFDVIAEIPPIESLEEQSSHRRSAWIAGSGSRGDGRVHPVRIGSNVFVRLEIMYKSFYNLQRNPFEITPDPVVFVSHDAAQRSARFVVLRSDGAPRIS